MTTTRFTPGPWAVNGGGSCVCEVQDYLWVQTAHTPEDPQADARLIAAAPDLYAALEIVNKLIAEAATTGFNWKDGDWADRLFYSQQQTSNALFKARGKS